MQSRTTLPPDAASVPAARRWAVALVLGSGCSAEAADATALVVTELASNAVKHAASPFTVELDTSLEADGTSVVRVAVTDEDSRLPRLEDVDSGALGGRGLHLIQSMSDSFGVDSTPEGKTVWVRLTAPHPAAPAQTEGLAAAVETVAAEFVRFAEELTAGAADVEPVADAADVPVAQDPPA